ncbi:MULTISPECIES: serine/threonine-protein kinase [unclassified Roseateles]|uniref:serine/threonine-protein kinase n=1 Tax=unclassified Roseateles TaxID=2626991 RepID=UPI0006FFB527|nr:MULTISPECIES: serine/threonine-protein kinase [unclassified Roseateles]KQW43413.1 hypothetical protein ASC81_16690 [Pelomonas sp. Root405]KRA71151.1 hypothetical protein ASD88_15210 [Pelomonas sp. Root662]
MKRLDTIAADWPAINALLDELLTLPPTERAAWVDALSDERARFKDTLRRLLAARGGVETDDFLKQMPPLPHLARAAPSDTATAGTRVGPYRLISELGHGGMGTVWLAERADGELKRQVALKLPRMAWDGSLAERLKRERDILASLTHPHIARLYDAGTDDHGRPYLAMEYVQGRPIDEHCEAEGASVAQRLRLLLQVCSAVAHAHAQLVIHRDLKPGNILVTAQGQVRLLDFGIAKLMEGDRTEETALTRMAGRALSLDYASPEQIRGDPIGTASDVYSLAVVAYELLAGQPPYRLKRGSAAEREEAIMQADAPRASDMAATQSLKKQLRGDLDAILNKALKKAPTDRYPTMVALADDIERHLDGRPVLARPESRSYLVRRFISRHRVGVAALTAVIVALSVGLATALWQTRVARLSEQSAEGAVDREGAVKMLMMDTLAEVASAGAQQLQTPTAAARMMRTKLDEYEVRFKDRPEQRLGLLEAVGSQLPFFGDYEGSLIVTRRYLALLKETKSDDWRVLRAHMGIARALGNLQRTPEAAAVLEEALATVPDSPGAVNNRVAVMADLGRALMRMDRREDAQRWLTAAVQRIPEFKDGSIRWATRSTLARFYLGFDDPQALQLMSAAHEEYMTYPEAQSSEKGGSFLFLGTALMNVGRAAEAERALAETVKRYGEIFGKVDRDTVIASARLAAAVAAQGRYPEANEMLIRKSAEVEAQPGPDTAIARATLAAQQLDTALKHGDLQAATPLATRDMTPALPADAALHQLGAARLLTASGQPAEAAQRLAQALNARPVASRWVLSTFASGMALAEARLAVGDARQALAGLVELAGAMQAQQAKRNATYGQALMLSALAQSRLGDHAQALALQEASDKEATDLKLPSRAEQADADAIRAEVLHAAGRPAAAAAALKAMKAALGGQHADSPRLKQAQRLSALLGA